MTYETKTIDITPTWSQAASMLALVLENGTEEGKRDARKELARMAELADKYVASQKENG